MPKVSVIVPIYNVERFLDRCVQSLRSQTLQDIEIILVDDQSPDHCPQMCDAYAQQDARIKVVHKKNGGLGYARNSGMEVASGEYVAFVDSDDYVDLDMFEKMYNAAIDCNADFVRVDNYKERMDGTIINLDYVPPMREGVYDQADLREMLLYPQLGMLPSDDGSQYVSCSVWRNIYRKKIIDCFGLRFVSERDLISEDIPFNIDFMMKSNRAVVINQKFYHYIINDNSLTQTYRADRFEKELILYNELIARTQKYDIYTKCKTRLSRHLLARTRMCIKNELMGNPDKKKAYCSVRKIIDSKEMKEIFSSYQCKALPLKYRVVYYLMKWKWVNVLNVIKTKL
ncbi:MAG: glycosyltransferase [Lachnospiraceae bacterium]|nr:glycosyltransferase [Lachnospiraceae bacterium]